MNLYDLLACPLCKTPVYPNGADQLLCNSCGTAYPIIQGTPVLLPNGQTPFIQHEKELNVRSTYDPWVHRAILQSLFDDQIVLEIGSGNMCLDDPCIIRMDVTLSPFVDVVGDAHCLPFLPESIDYIFSLAVFEHLRNPFIAARSIYDTLKDGGYIYHECNFIYAYHGYPHHYFNATLQGMESTFADFKLLRDGVAPYQMPSFALDMVLRSYIAHSHAKEFDHGRRIIKKIEGLLNEDLMQYDLYFDENQALNLAAGTYFSGVKKKTDDSSLLPEVLLRHWREDPKLQQKFPHREDLATTNNIVQWAFSEGQNEYPDIKEFLASVKPFNKRGETAKWNREVIRSMEVIEPRYGAIGYPSTNSMSDNSILANQKKRKADVDRMVRRVRRLLSRIKQKILRRRPAA